MALADVRRNVPVATLEDVFKIVKLARKAEGQSMAAAASRDVNISIEREGDPQVQLDEYIEELKKIAEESIAS